MKKKYAAGHIHLLFIFFLLLAGCSLFVFLDWHRKTYSLQSRVDFLEQQLRTVQNKVEILEITNGIRTKQSARSATEP